MDLFNHHVSAMCINLLHLVRKQQGQLAWLEMAKEGVVTDSHVYQQAKKFAESISAGDVVVKHTELTMILATTRCHSKHRSVTGGG